MTRKAWLEIVSLERDKQDRKWGEQNHTPDYWVGILGEEFGEFARAVIERDLIAAKNEAVQVAAVAIAILECSDRNDWPSLGLLKNPSTCGERRP